MGGLLERLKLLLPGQQAEDALLLEILGAAEAFMLNYTGRSSLPAALHSAQLQLAVQLYNRLGSEGERARREGALSLQFEAFPPGLLSQLKAWRLAKAGGP